MTEGPLDDETLDDPWHDQLEAAQDTYGSPEVVAVVALVLAVGSVFGFGVLNGSVYTAPWLAIGPNHAAVVTGALIGAALSLLPVWLGWRVSSRALAGDATWVSVAARTALVLGLVSLVLRLVVAVLQATHHDPSGFSRL